MFTLTVLACSGGTKDHRIPESQSPLPVHPNDEAAVISETDSIAIERSPLRQEEQIRLPKEEDSPSAQSGEEEVCDGEDNDLDGEVDEGCCLCKPGAKPGDFDGDDGVTIYDANCPLLWAYGKTPIPPGGPKCCDLDDDGLCGMSDTMAVLDKLRGEAADR